MSDSSKMLEGLKRMMKLRGIRYCDLAEASGLSESSIKRILSSGQSSLSLERLEEFCSIAGVRISELCEFVEISDRNQEFTYTLEQEEYFVSHPKALRFFDTLLDLGRTRIKTERLAKDIGISKVELRRITRELEELKLLIRLTEDWIQLKVPRFVHWREKGPLRKKFLEKAKKEFLDHEFHGQKEKFLFGLYELSDRSVKELISNLEKVKKESFQIGEVEKSAGQNTQKIGCLVAVRPWNFSALEEDVS